MRAQVVVAHGLSCSVAIRAMWNLPGPAIEHVFPALVGRLSPTIPPGKSFLPLLIRTQSYWITALHL